MAAAADEGVAYDNDSYCESGIERRARLYEKYASLRDLGIPAPGLPLTRIQNMSATGLMEYAYDGGIARECALVAGWFRKAA